MGNILNDFDSDRSAIVESWMVEGPVDGFPEIAVATFSKRIIDAFSSMDGARQISEFRSGGGDIPIYGFDYAGTPVALYVAQVGAPACAMQLEEVISKGSRTVVVFGSCGVLNKEIADGRFIIPVSAVRDEGTSYHYHPASGEIDAEAGSVKVLADTMDQMGYPWIQGKTWTIDAPYRETKGKAALRKSQGCVCVEMECAAMLAVARFRGIRYAQFLYAADNLDAPDWDPRKLFAYDLKHRERYMLVALEAAVRLHTPNDIEG